MLYLFHANLFACPDELAGAPPIELRGQCFNPRRVAAWTTFFPVTFEQAFDALNALPRIDAEPDGFFVASGDFEGRRWQIDGHLFDFEDRLHRVELHGQCPPEAFDRLLACFGWPAVTLAFELVDAGVALDEAEFRRFAVAPRC